MSGGDDSAQGPLKCCKCSRDAVGRVSDMVEVRGEDKQWHWLQAPGPRGYCPFHESQSTPRWIDRDNRVMETQPATRKR
jgi:hypothetical protein